MNNDFEEKRPNYLILVIILIVFLITLVILVYYIRFQTSISPKASSVNISKQISVSNSYIFASPVRAKAGGDLIRVTVFVLNDEGEGLFDKLVKLQPDTSNIVVKDIQSLSDDTGKAIFDLSSNTVGDYTIQFSVDNLILPQSLKVVFDNGTE